VLQGFGIDPDLPLASADEEVASEEEVVVTATSAASTTGSSSSAGDRAAGSNAAVPHNPRAGGPLVAVAMPSMAWRDEKKAEEAFCDYCGGDGHAEEECPHRLHARPDSGESTDCGDTCDEDDVEEDM
jgi:hypothetical protein